MATPNQKSEGHFAVAKALNIPVSTKHCIEICRNLRFKDVSFAKKYLEDVVQLKRAVEFKRFVMNTGHKPGMSTGRYPAKAASEILKLIKSVEANAHFKGLNTTSLKITKLVANRASKPFGGGRHRTATKRSHVEIEVKERGVAGKGKAKTVEPAKITTQVKEHKETVTATHAHEDHGHAHPHNHDHADHKHESAHPSAASAVKPAVKAKVAAESAEPSSAELLRQAQQKAADLKRQEKDRKDAQQVENLYEELQKKGSLRSSQGVRK